MKALCVSETPKTGYQSTRRDIRQGMNFNQHRCANLKYCSLHGSVFAWAAEQVTSMYRGSVTFVLAFKTNYGYSAINPSDRAKFLQQAKEFNVHGSVHRNNTLIYPTRCNITQFILSRNCSTCFGWYHNPSSGAQTTVSTASGICYTVIAICRCRGRIGTGLSVLWVAYATHSTLKPVPTLPR
jgi:hypothetical protein